MPSNYNIINNFNSKCNETLSEVGSYAVSRPMFTRKSAKTTKFQQKEAKITEDFQKMTKFTAKHVDQSLKISEC